MEANWIAERSMLRHLLTLYPTWSSTEVARCLGRSASWVKKWRKRFHGVSTCFIYVSRP
jgi:hypothetical protein